MKRVCQVVLLSVVVSLATGCFRAPVTPPVARVFTNWEAPLNLSFDESEGEYRSGKATSVSILGLLAFGDASVATAARNGRLETVDHVGYRTLIVLFGVYQGWTTVAYGH